MRVMIKFSFPAAVGNQVVGSGKINQIFHSLMEDVKPEAAYLYPENGQRGGLLIVNMTDSSQVAEIGERLWHALQADVQMTPVMSPEDLQKGLSGIENIVKRYS